MISCGIRASLVRGTGGVGLARAVLQYLNSGFPTSLLTGSGSALVADYAGVLRKANTPSPAIEGGRLVSAEAGWTDTLPDGTTPLQPYEMVRTVNGSVKRYIDYPTIQRSQAYALGFKAVAIASDGIQRYYECTTAGTTAASAPSFGTSGTTADGTAVWTYRGYATMNYKRVLGEPARTNKVTARKVNPVDTTNVTVGGGSAAEFVLSVVDNSAELATAGLNAVCTSGKVYKADNSLGAGSSFVDIGGTVGNLNPHSFSIYARRVGSSPITSIRLSDGTSNIPITATTFTRYTAVNFTPIATGRFMKVYIGAGDVVYFILPELIEAPFLGSPVVPGPGETNALASYTRPATTNRIASEGILRSQNWGARIQVNPKAAGQTAYALSTYTDANNETSLLVAPTALTFRKRIATVDTDCTVNYSHAANVPVQIDIRQDAVLGMGIRTRALNGADWSNWTDWEEVATAAGLADCVIATNTEIGSRNAAGQIAGNINLVQTVFSATPQTVLEGLQ